MKLNLKKWGDPTFGTTGGTVTFSFSRPDEAAPGWSRVKGAARQDLARQAFEDWADVLDLKFREVKGDADIHFGFAPLDGLGGTRTGEAEVTSTTDGRVVSASILLDVDEKWIYDPEWNGCFTFACLPEGFAIPIGGSAADLLDDESNFYYVALHEVGHAIGILSHFDKDGTVMKGGHSAISLSRTDIKVAQRLYGDDPDGEVKRGDDGKDALNGGAKNDKLFGRGGADGLKGRGGDDLLDGGAGRDVLAGGAGDDRLKGAGGADALNGGGGDDDLRGGAGRDRLKGGKANDRLEGGDGRDVLTGGAGRDVFVLRQGDGADVATDFDPARDRVKLVREDGVLGRLLSTDKGAAFDLPGAELLLRGVEAGRLDLDMILV